MATQADSAKVSRTKRLAANTRDRAERVARGIEASRDRVTPVDIALSTAERDRSASGDILAGALAYRAFLWLLPATLTTVLVFGLVSSASDTDPAKVVNKSGLPALAASSVASAAQQDNRGRVAAIIVAVVALWSASGSLLKALRAVHGFAWRERPPKLRSRMRARAGFLAITLGTFVVSAGASSLRRASPGLGLGVIIALVAVYAAVWWGATCLLPHGDAPAIALLPGAVLFGVAVQVMHLVTVFYLAPQVSSASELYGDLGGASILLLWLYLMSRLIVATAMLNASMWGRRQERRV